MQNEITILSQFFLRNSISNSVSLDSSIMKDIAASRSRFLVKLICCIAFGSRSSASYILKSIAIILEFSMK